MTRKQRRLALIGAVFTIVAAAAALMLFALKDNIVFFNSPSEVAEKRLPPGTRFRLGGLVEEGSVVRGPGQSVQFRVSDGKASLAVSFTGLLPDLFREKQGVVAEGRLSPDHVFIADTVLAKHDENYLPREVADALKKQGHWNPAAVQTPQPAIAPAATTPETGRPGS